METVMVNEEQDLEGEGTLFRDGKNYCKYTGKRAYADEWQAADVARHQESEGAPPLDYYYCVWCRCYHLTRQ